MPHQRKRRQAREVTAPLPLGERGEISPEELDVEFFNQLDTSLQRVEEKQFESTLGDLADRGFLRSGETFSRVAEDVIGPGIERRQKALGGIAERSALRGREERLIGEGREFESEEREKTFQRELTLLSRRAQVQRELLELQDSLSGDSFGFGEFLGQAAGIGAGAFFGGAGGAAGKAIGSQLFSRSGSSGDSGRRRTDNTSFIPN